MNTTETSQLKVPKGPLKIAQRFNAGESAAPGHVPKGRLKECAGASVQSSLRDSNSVNDVPGVETPGYSRDVPPGRSSDLREALSPILAAKLSVNRSKSRQVLECGDGVFGVAALGRGGSGGDELQILKRSQRQSGDFADSVTSVQDANAPKPLCVIPQPSRHVVLLFSVAAVITASLLVLCPASARAQGGVPLWTHLFFVSVVDSSGNLFGQGSSGVMKYSGERTPLWTNLPRAAGLIAIDSSGQCIR